MSEFTAKFELNNNLFYSVLTIIGDWIDFCYYPEFPDSKDSIGTIMVDSTDAWRINEAIDMAEAASILDEYRPVSWRDEPEFMSEAA